MTHYAGVVEYMNTGFVGKNMDSVHIEHVSLIRGSKVRVCVWDVCVWGGVWACVRGALHFTCRIVGIAGHFRGTKFSRFSGLTLEPSASKSLFTVGLWSNKPLSSKIKSAKCLSLSN